MTAAELIKKWSNAGGSESSNAASFTNNLCDLLGVDHPEPFKPVDADNTYVFEKPVRGRNGNLKFIDVYKRMLKVSLRPLPQRAIPLRTSPPSKRKTPLNYEYLNHEAAVHHHLPKM